MGIVRIQRQPMCDLMPRESCLLACVRIYVTLLWVWMWQRERVWMCVEIRGTAQKDIQVDSQEFLSSGQNHKALILALKFLLGVCILVCVSVCLGVFVFLYFYVRLHLSKRRTHAAYSRPEPSQQKTHPPPYSHSDIACSMLRMHSHESIDTCPIPCPPTILTNSSMLVVLCTAPLLRDNTCAPASY